MAIKTFKRYEYKYLIDESQYRAMLAALEKTATPDKYCVGGKTYGLYNLYCDTDCFDVIRHSVSKPNFKQKLRIRSYVPHPADTDTVFVELKKKFDGCVNKRRAVMTFLQAKTLIKTGKGHRTGDFLTDQVIYELERYLAQYRVYPRVSVSYQRSAFFLNEDKNIRITFDTQVKAALLGSEPEKLVPDGVYLMEIKINEKLPLWLIGVLSANKIYRRGFSKYGTYFNNYIAGKDLKLYASADL